MADANPSAMRADYQVSRRNILFALPAAGAALALPVAAASETPVMQAFRDWDAYWTRLNGPATRGMPEEQFDALVARADGYVARVAAAPARTPQDVIAKLFTILVDSAVIYDLPNKDAISAEARALIGGAA